MPKLPLIDYPSDAPSRVPFTRGVPSEGAIALNTGMLPRTLPGVHFDAAPGVAIYDAITRAGSNLSQLGNETLGILLAAERKKQEAKDVLAADELYTEATTRIDQALEERRLLDDHTSFKPNFLQRTQDISREILQKAPNGAVQQHVALKLGALYRERFRTASDIERGKLVDHAETLLLKSNAEDVRQAVGAETDEFAKPWLDSIESRFVAYAKAGLIPQDRLEKTRDKVLKEIVMGRARKFIHEDPKGFLDLVERGKYEPLRGYPEEAQRLAEYAETRWRTALNDKEREQARLDRDAKKAQDQLVTDTEAQLRRNWSPEGPRQDMGETLANMRRELGREGYHHLAALDEAYRKSYEKEERASDPRLAADLRAKIAGKQFKEVSFQDLRQWFENHVNGGPGINQRDYESLASYLSSELEQENARHRADQKDARAQARQARQEQAQHAKGILEDRLQVSNRLDPTREVQTLRADALSIYWRRVESEPNKDPYEIADEVATRFVPRVDLKDIPYSSKDQVLRDYKDGVIDRRLADYYIGVLDEIARRKAPTPPVPSGELRKPRKNP